MNIMEIIQLAQYGYNVIGFSRELTEEKTGESIDLHSIFSELLQFGQLDNMLIKIYAPNTNFIIIIVGMLNAYTVKLENLKAFGRDYPLELYDITDEDNDGILDTYYIRTVNGFKLVYSNAQLIIKSLQSGKTVTIKYVKIEGYMFQKVR